jgi:hypothetical protein
MCTLDDSDTTSSGVSGLAIGKEGPEQDEKDEIHRNGCLILILKTSALCEGRPKY